MAVKTSPSPARSFRTAYLTFYNISFALLWSFVFVKTVRNIPHGRHAVFASTEPLARWVQTLTLVEVVHSVVGLIPSPLGTTFTQVATRIIQVWLIWRTFPETTASSLVFSSLLLAWSIADTVRYGYLAANLHGKAPKWLVWLRYSLFIPLYPIGIGAEWWLMFQAAKPVGEIHAILPYVFYFLLALYIPGSYMMFTYMLKQRKKTLARSSKNARSTN
ncbi:unnamed protein product [Zymoseptoria tritici ST99CH_1E4]|uniref:Very-long-chain (3R)-3-hydroxyacyl-CoA dehydratase n=1 Tax=Zymoseptoria tritici ST99CH_1E4 TaxID=1276532 RepID=A0A2H1GZ12_ZYMTR|nr:unnamed protein product [Zymoseptoria tritici ST99CH_1E4]